MDFDKDDSAGYLANHLARLLERRLAEAIRPLGIVPGQFPILLELWRRDGQNQKMLVEAIDVEQATLANTLARMERDGLIRREPDPNDQRSRLIRLTARAKRLEREATEAADAVNERALRELPAGQRQAFLATMRAMIANLK